MTSIEAALIAALSADTGVTAAVGTRLFVFGARQGVTMPYCTIQRVSTTRADHLDGPATLEWPRLQLDIWAASPTDASNAADVLESAIEAKTFSALGRTMTATFAGRDGPGIDEETRNFRVRLDYFIWSERN